MSPQVSNLWVQGPLHRSIKDYSFWIDLTGFGNTRLPAKMIPKSIMISFDSLPAFLPNKWQKKTISQKSHRSEKLLEVADTLSFKRLRLPSQREKGKSRRSSLDHRGQSTASLFMLQLFDSFVNFDCKAWLVKAWTQPNCGEQADGTRLEPRHGTKNYLEPWRTISYIFN